MFFRKLIKTITGALLFATLNPAHAQSSKKQDVVYWQEDTNGHVTFFADNPNPIPYTVEVKFDVLENMRASQQAPFVFALAANSRKIPLFNLQPKRGSGYRFTVTSMLIPGFADKTRPDDAHLYWLPFEHGTKHQVGQAYFGNATHTPPNPYAIDFNMDTGTKVTAAREGIVSEIKQDSNIGGPRAEFAKYANHVTIFHSDGTFANYAHLKRGGVSVKLGQSVRAGQVIGLSGNTGQSSGPHLHFEVYRFNADGESRNLPVKFLTHDDNVYELAEGQFYYARHPGKPKFDVNLGSKITKTSVIKTQPFEFTDSFDISTETIDNTMVVYANNGTRTKIEYELTLKLKNLSSSRHSPIKDSVEPLTKQFVAILRPEDNHLPSEMGYSLKRQRISPAIDDKQYAKHQKTIPFNNTIKVLSQQVDDKVLLFAQNGYKQEKSLTITLKISNLRPSKGVQMTVEIPPLTEVYLQHLIPVNAVKASQLGWALQWY